MKKISYVLEKHPEEEWYRFIIDCDCNMRSSLIIPIEKEDVDTIKRIFKCRIEVTKQYKY